MSCTIIDLAYKNLWKNDVLIKDKTGIKDISRFNNINKIFSDIARDRFGVLNQDTLFDVKYQRGTNDGSLVTYSNVRWENLPYAVINKTFADEFQEKHEYFYNQKALNETITPIDPGYTIDPEEVDYNRQERTFLDFINEKPNVDLGNAIENGALLENQARANEISIKIAEKLSKQTGISYEIINADLASAMLKNAEIPYNNEAGFFYKDKAYFVQDFMTLNTVFHEFAHPILKAIYKDNNTLFNNLFNQLQLTPEGRNIINTIEKLYPEHDKNSARFKEEAIVKALELNAVNIRQETEGIKNESDGFTKFIKNLLFQVKQYLRKVFGRVRIEKLKSDTTLGELANMLVNNDFKLTSPEITNKDIVDFARETERLVNEVLTAVEGDTSRKRLQEIIDNFSAHAILQKKTITNVQLRDISKKLVDETNGGGLLTRITQNLSPYTATKFSEKKDVVKDVIDDSSKVLSFVNSLTTLDKVIEIVKEHLDTVDKSTDNYQTNINKAQYYNYLLDDWAQFINQTIEDFENVNLSEKTEIYALVNRLKAEIAAGKKTFIKIQGKTAVKATMDVLTSYIENLDKVYEARIKEIEEILAKNPNNKAAKTELAKVTEEWKTEQITEDKITRMFKGETSQASWWAGMFLSYTDSPDPIIGSLAVYIKNNLSKLQNDTYRNIKKFNKSISEDLKKLNITGANVGEEFKPFLFEDTDYKYENGKLVKRPVLRFLNPHKDWNYALEEKDSIISKAEEDLDKTPTQEELDSVNKTIEQYKKDKKELLKLAIKSKEEMLNKYFNREFSSEVYEANNRLLTRPNGELAYIAKQKALDVIKNVSDPNMSELDAYNIHDEVSAAWNGYSQLFSLTNTDGTKKTGDDLLIAEALIENRNETNKFYEWLPKKGAFEKALSSYEDQLRLSEPNLSEEEYDKKVNSWINQNTNIRYTDEYYDSLTENYDSLQELRKLLPAELQEKSDTASLMAGITAIMSIHKDELGLPDGTTLNDKEKEKIRELQNQINTIYEDFSLTTFGLTLDEYEDYENIKDSFEKFKKDKIEIITQEDANRLEEYENKIKDFKSKVNILTIGTISAILTKLSEIKGKVASEHYITIANEMLTNAEQPIITEETANSILKPEFIDNILYTNPMFKKWFDENHITKSFYNKKTREKETRYERLNCWSVSKPKDASFYQSTPITRNGKTYLINRVPSIKYKFRVVKNEYRTIPFGLTAEEKNQFVGSIIDNKGEYLPKSKEQGAPLDSPFINEAYYDMKNNMKDHYDLLNKLKDWHLENQKGVTYQDKLYLDLPRYIQGDLEGYQSGEKVKRIKDIAQHTLAGAKAYLSGKGKEAANKASIMPGDYEEDMVNAFNNEEETDAVMFVNKSISNPNIDRLPIRGTSRLTPAQTSKDVLKALKVYAYHAEKQRLFNEINPIAKAIVQTLENPDNAIKNLKQIQGRIGNTRNVFNPTGESNIRASIARALYDREFKGAVYSEKHLDWLNKVTSGIMKAASFNYFALNLPSAIKNYWGALFQANLEAIAGEHMNLMTLGKGKLWSKQAMIDWTQRIYGADNDSLYNQMIIHFDPMEGKAEEAMVKDTSRTIYSDLASMTWLYSPRKFMEMEAALQLFGGMMYYKTIKQTVNGVEREIPYMEAFELDANNNMVLKDGIDKEYDINGKKYFEIKNLIHQKTKDLNGAFAKYEQPQAQAHFAYRLFMFMRRYFTSMFMYRFGTKRHNITTGKQQTGFYIESLKGMAKVITSMGEYIPVMSKTEKQAIYKLITEFGQILAIGLIASLFFGYDDNDPERFAKLREKSGPLGADDFKLWGFVSNHTLSLLLKTQNENESLIPLPKYGLNDYVNMASVSSVSFVPTIKSYAKILTDATMMLKPGEDPSTEYQIDSGPYPWQKEGSDKIFNHMANIFGLSGSDVDPLKGLKNLEMQQKR